MVPVCILRSRDGRRRCHTRRPNGLRTIHVVRGQKDGHDNGNTRREVPSTGRPRAAIRLPDTKRPDNGQVGTEVVGHGPSRGKWTRLLIFPELLDRWVSRLTEARGDVLSPRTVNDGARLLQPVPLEDQPGPVSRVFTLWTTRLLH